ncbi:methylmalonyl-CoA epimerase [Desulfosarcina ovata subsp. sediminis]|uniref:Methylmalonyl-CoA epimerase n=1 Tax=Desulfosarcina ovata subsp. sediminis TaxID=885957 RepID=A0A5K7ZGR6_9BACT|nr:VOC family protein [Desulfosarcina ovata]BBO81292.1 methylmalonyl-CoA epimerase [Desulfosarcina ovata subsp. sediminis]
MVIDHIGLVVRSLNNGVNQWENLFGYQKATDIVINTKQKVRVVFLSKRNSITIKLIEPTDKDSPIYDFAKRGGGLHHLCFKCKRIDEQLCKLKQNGARCIVPPQPGEAFDNHDIAFIYTGNNLNVELIDTDIKKGWGFPNNK